MRRGLTGAVVNIKEPALGAQQLVGHHSVDIQVCIQGQDGPVEHRQGGPWAGGEGSLQGQLDPPPSPPPPRPGEPWLTMDERRGGEADGVGALGRAAAALAD